MTSRHLTSALILLICLTFSQACKSGSADSGSGDPSPAASSNEPGAPTSQPASATAPEEDHDGQPLAAPVPEGMAVATFAGGCFWCMEGPFEKIEGVEAALSGYTGGSEQHPTYELVSSGRTGHTEAVRVIYDPKLVTYDTLLDTYWRSMDPTDAGGQFADRGSQYRPAIFTHTPEQAEQARASKEALQKSGRFADPIIVPIEPAGDFWVAEDYHQDYYLTHTDHYNRYRRGSGRAGFLEKIWGDSKK